MMSPLVVIGLVKLLGTSAETSALNVGAAAVPDDGPAKTRFAFWLLSVTANVPALVTGEPLTLCHEGTVKPTLVTEPTPVEAPMTMTWAAVAPFAAAAKALTTLSARHQALSDPQECCT